MADYVSSPEFIEEQKLKAPMSSWLQIISNGDGQVIVPPENYKWTNLSGKQVYLASTGNVLTINEKKSYSSPDNFRPTASEKLHSYQITRFNKKLKEKFDIDSDLKHLYHLRVFGNNVGFVKTDYFTYDLTLYSNDKELRYILVCLDYCYNSEPEVVSVELKY